MDCMLGGVAKTKSIGAIMCVDALSFLCLTYVSCGALTLL